jgi:hypothetical protein
VNTSVAAKLPRSCAVVHRSETVLHAGGEVLAGTKRIMQFGLLYEAPQEPRRAIPLRWGT